MSELADELDSKSSGKPCGFEPHYRYSNDRHTFTVCLLLFMRTFSQNTLLTHLSNLTMLINGYIK